MKRAFRNIIISLIIGAAVYLFVYYSETGILPVFSEQWKSILISGILVILLGFAIDRLNLYFNKHYIWTKSIGARFAIEISAALLVWLSLSLILYISIEFWLFQPFEDENFRSAFKDGILKYSILSVAIIYLVSLINFSMFSFQQYSAGEIDALSLERNQLKLRFEALKNQLNPHFLFNALNTISSLLYKDVLQAENYIRQLAATYQFILRSGNKSLIPLSEEMEMVTSYFFMQQTRHGECAQLSIELADEIAKILVPPLSIQMLIENALKHNKICKETILSIKVYSEEDKFLVVKNNVLRKPELIKIGNKLVNRPDQIASPGIGLSNIRSRYRLLQKNEIVVSKNHDFTVKLPIIYAKSE
ncbi:MAG: histidine kinase [Bacteroidales bacterium]|nr:histidine kinase [Bacteroidales bacterium]